MFTTSLRASGGMADAHGSGPCVRKDVGVQLPPRPSLPRRPLTAEYAVKGLLAFTTDPLHRPPPAIFDLARPVIAGSGRPRGRREWPVTVIGLSWLGHSRAPPPLRTAASSLIVRPAVDSVPAWVISVTRSSDGGHVRVVTVVESGAERRGRPNPQVGTGSRRCTRPARDRWGEPARATRSSPRGDDSPRPAFPLVPGVDGRGGGRGTWWANDTVRADLLPTAGQAAVGPVEAPGVEGGPAELVVGPTGAVDALVARSAPRWGTGPFRSSDQWFSGRPVDLAR